MVHEEEEEEQCRWAVDHSFGLQASHEELPSSVFAALPAQLLYRSCVRDDARQAALSRRRSIHMRAVDTRCLRAMAAPDREHSTRVWRLNDNSRTT